MPSCSLNVGLPICASGALITTVLLVSAGLETALPWVSSSGTFTPSRAISIQFLVATLVLRNVTLPVRVSVYGRVVMAATPLPAGVNLSQEHLALADLDSKLGAFAGRPKKDNWMDQARHLAAGDKAAFEAQFGKL